MLREFKKYVTRRRKLFSPSRASMFSPITNAQGSVMMRKLRRLCVPFCLGSCFSIGLIIAIIRFALYVDSLIAMHERTDPEVPPDDIPLDSPPILVHRNSSWISFISPEVAASYKGGDANGQTHAGERLWFMSGGNYFPTPPIPMSKLSRGDYANLLYHNSIGSDRVIAQLMFTIDDPSKGHSATQSPLINDNIKTIFLSRNPSWSDIANGQQVDEKCPVNACRLTKKRAERRTADVVVYTDVQTYSNAKRPTDQLWVVYMLESPLNSRNFRDDIAPAFNLTATYRHDSDIATPYAKWVYFDDTVRSLPQAINYAAGKTKKVAWSVSNCNANNNRLQYAKELAKYIEVDIYGGCGTQICSKANTQECLKLFSTNYKFYLSFENSNCRDYVTEKFFANGLGNNVIPIVMGAHPDDYKRMAPQGSYIHVDDFPSPKELADYLIELDANDPLYNDYFKWKGTGEFINDRFFCRLCAMAHYASGSPSPKQPSTYDDFDMWWRGSYVCTSQSWRSVPDMFAVDNYSAM